MNNMMDSKMLRLFLFSLRLLQGFGSLTIILIEILRHTNIIYLIESKNGVTNDYELFFEYCVMNLGFVLSVLYLFRFNQRCKQGPYKYDIFIDCVLMNAWMIFGMLRLAPEFSENNILACNLYKESKPREGCTIYISTLVLGYVISASYFFTSIISTWLWSEYKNSQIISNSNNSNSNSNCNHSISILNSNSPNVNNSDPNNISNFNLYINPHFNLNPINTNTNSSSSLLDPTKLTKTKLSRKINDLPQVVTDDAEFNRSDGTIIIFRKPSPSFLRYEQSSNHSSIYENNSCISEYSLGSSFSRTYGSIIIPRKYSEDSNVISTYSDNSTNSKRLSSTFSDKTSRSSKYDGSIIIKLVT